MRRAPRAGTPGSEGRSRGRVERAAGKRQRGLAGRRGWRWAGVGGVGNGWKARPGGRSSPAPQPEPFSNGYSCVTVGLPGRAGGLCGKALRRERAERKVHYGSNSLRFPGAGGGGGGTQTEGAGPGRGRSLGAGPGRLLRALYGVSRAWAGAGSLDGQEPRVARFLARWGLRADGAQRCSGSGPSLRGWHGICGGMYSFAE